MNKKYDVSFFDANGICYFRKTAKHIDITTYCTVIDFSTDGQSEKNVFRSFDEMQTIKIIQNFFIVEFVSGQRITIAINRD